MAVLGELEIRLRRVRDGAYEEELRLVDPEAATMIAPVRGLVQIDFPRMKSLELQPEVYGEELTRRVFADRDVRESYVRARAVMAKHKLRLSIAIEPSEHELNDLRWELLHDPVDGKLLATSDEVWLSRFMYSRDWRRVRRYSRAQLRAVIAVAAPSDHEDWQLAEIKAGDEIARARAALPDVPVEVVGDREPCTLDRLIRALRGGADIVYLVCHGVHRTLTEPALYLQDESGRTAVVRGQELADRIGDMAEPPRMVVLASCEGAKRPEYSLAALLADAGVAAVLAMQGTISVATVEALIPRFFQNLFIDGQIDRALAAARGPVRAHPDAWMPALFLRLKNGQLWYEPRLTGSNNAPPQWNALCQCVRQGKLVPIVGPDLDEGLFGGMHALASRLAETRRYPNADHERADLAKVAQYINIEEGRRAAREAVQAEFEGEIARRQGVTRAALPALLDVVADLRMSRDGDPYKALARLPVSVYLTASPETLLAKMLRRTGKTPEAMLCRWRAAESEGPHAPQAPQLVKVNPQRPKESQPPTAEAPLVYHVFGMFGVPESLVLTEDDFFDYLIATSSLGLLPDIIGKTLVEGALIFLGFRLDDWTFRVLFRFIMNLGGAAKLRERPHVGVQINPEEHSLADVERARAYLERYFGSDRGVGLDEPPIMLFWGSPADFLRELTRQMEATKDDHVPTPVEKLKGWF